MKSLLLILLALTVKDDPDDHRLALGIKRGDSDAFSEFYEKYQGSLLSFLVSKGISRTDAEDLLQNTFLIIWDKRDSIQPDRSLKSFLYTIAYRRMLNHIRDQKAGDSEFAFQLADESQNPSETTDTNLTMHAVQKAIEALPEKRRRVFELCYLEDLSYREAGEALDISRKTVENHMILALKDLRAAMKRFFPEQNL